jgi:hypothetical protein
MFKRFFGKKNDGFYMQAEESVAKAPEKKAPDKKEPVVVDVAPVAVPEKKEELVIAEAPTATKTSVKDKKKEKPEKSSKKAALATEAAVATTVVSAEPAITNFATDYLIKPSSNSNRRRPGANMKQFMDMARQVETKKSPGQRAKSN